jgi:hypothetical protein
MLVLWSNQNTAEAPYWIENTEGLEAFVPEGERLKIVSSSVPQRILWAAFLKWLDSSIGGYEP